MDLNSKLIYPNPFKPVGIEFDLPEDAIVTLTIVDDAGQKVCTLMSDAHFEAGHHRYMMDLSGKINKKHVYRLVARGRGGEYVETKRIG